MVGAILMTLLGGILPGRAGRPPLKLASSPGRGLQALWNAEMSDSDAEFRSESETEPELQEEGGPGRPSQFSAALVPEGETEECCFCQEVFQPNACAMIWDEKKFHSDCLVTWLCQKEKQQDALTQVLMFGAHAPQPIKRPLNGLAETLYDLTCDTQPFELRSATPTPSFEVVSTPKKLRRSDGHIA